MLLDRGDCLVLYTDGVTEAFRVDRLSTGSPTGERDDMAVLVA